MQRLNFRAFTLVELIVVITIVGILSTVGFVSYSGYLTGARDSNRISQMVKLSDSLQVYSTTKSLPLPDDYIEITASGTTIAYQGEVGVDVLETIDFTNGGKDPRDDSYYTYYLTKDRKKIQLLTFLEEQGNISYNELFFEKSYAIDYTNRYPKTYGAKLGVLTQVDTNIPAQKVGGVTGVDIIVDSSSYVAHLGRNQTVTGGDLVSIFLNQNRDTFIDKNLAVYDTSLVGYWDMETLDGGALKDFSTYGNNGTLHGGVSVGGTKGKSGNATLFDGDDDYITIPNSVSLNPDDAITIVTLTKSRGAGTNSCNGSGICFPRVLGKRSADGSSSAEQYAFWWNYFGDKDGAFQFRLDTENYTATTGTISNHQFKLVDNAWNNIVFSYDSKKSKMYVNGEILGYEDGDFSGTLIDSNYDLIIGNSNNMLTLQRAFYGEIDEIRIYNRILGLDEIKRIYTYY